MSEYVGVKLSEPEPAFTPESVDGPTAEQPPISEDLAASVTEEVESPVPEDSDVPIPEPTAAPESADPPPPERKEPTAKRVWRVPELDGKALAQWVGPVAAVVITLICVLILFQLIIGPIRTALAQGEMTKQPEWIIRFFFSLAIGVFLTGCAVLGGFYVVATLKRVREMEGEHKEYQLYMKKGYNLRANYGVCLFIDMLLHIVELVAVGISAYLLLIIKSGGNNEAAAMLITSLVVSTIRNALNLKFSRMSYARAFRILEFATDDFRVSPQGPEDIAALHRANEKAQAIIQDLSE